MSEIGKRYLGLAPIKREGGIYYDDPEFEKLNQENYNLKAENARLSEAVKNHGEQLGLFLVRIDTRGYYVCEAVSEEIERLRRSNKRIKHEAYLAAVSETCDVEETGDYYSGFCDGVQAAAAAVERMK